MAKMTMEFTDEPNLQLNRRALGPERRCDQVLNRSAESKTGGIRETQDMLEFYALQKIKRLLEHSASR